MQVESYSSVDYHTGGEPFRIVTELPVAIEGDTVAAKRVTAIGDDRVQRIRQILCHEPRGHADMYGGFIVPPDDDGADLGVLFWHKDGFSTACGHGTIALGTWAIESGLRSPDPCGMTDVVIDVPSGRVTARVHTCTGQVTGVGFRNVPSYVLARDVGVSTSRGQVVVDVSYGGAIYAQLHAAQVGLQVAPGQAGDLIAVGREITRALNDSDHATHPTDPRLSGIYGTILYESAPATDRGLVHQRNVAIFADGQLDRSPCGSGTAARIATLTADGTLPVGATLVHESIVGSRFTATVVQQVRQAGRPAVIAEVHGRAHQTGEHRFIVDPRDTLVPGFVLR